MVATTITTGTIIAETTTETDITETAETSELAPLTALAYSKERLNIYLYSAPKPKNPPKTFQSSLKPSIIMC